MGGEAPRHPGATLPEWEGIGEKTCGGQYFPGNQSVAQAASLDDFTGGSRCGRTHSWSKFEIQFGCNKIETHRAANAEPIAYIIPKWHIETWIAYLHGEDVNEAEKETYKKKYGKISERKDVHPLIDKLADNCKENIQLESLPDSLVAACEEFDRIRSTL